MNTCVFMAVPRSVMTIALLQLILGKILLFFSHPRHCNKTKTRSLISTAYRCLRKFDRETVLHALSVTYHGGAPRIFFCLKARSKISALWHCDRMSACSTELSTCLLHDRFIHPLIPDFEPSSTASPLRPSIAVTMLYAYCGFHSFGFHIFHGLCSRATVFR